MPKVEGATHPSSLSASAEPLAPARPLVLGLGPHGERPFSPDQIALSDRDTSLARRSRFKVAIVFHTLDSDWARQQIAGLTATLGEHAGTVADVVDCGFSVDRQVEALDRLARSQVHAVVSIPLGNTAALVEAHRAVSSAGIKLLLLDNAPGDLLPETDYASVVSADNFGLGEIAAALLSPHIPEGGKIGLVAYRLGFFATAQREIAFRRWIEQERPDILIRHVKFERIEHVESLVAGFLDANADTAGLFAVWDGPAIRAMRAVLSRSRVIPMTTIDLGAEVAMALAENKIIKGIGAQRPYDQGDTCAKAVLSALAGNKVPSWIVLPGLAVTLHNVIDAFQTVWHANAPTDLLAAATRDGDADATCDGPLLRR